MVTGNDIWRRVDRRSADFVRSCYRRALRQRAADGQDDEGGDGHGAVGIVVNRDRRLDEVSAVTLLGNLQTPTTARC